MAWRLFVDEVHPKYGLEMVGVKMGLDIGLGNLHKAR